MIRNAITNFDGRLGICAPKGLENIAQVLPWVCCFSAARPEGAPESQRVIAGVENRSLA